MKMYSFADIYPTMSYKHNNLMAMRERYWNDTENHHVGTEKAYLQDLLQQQGIYENANLEDVKYFFFSLPSIIIVKGYAHGFMHHSVQEMIIQHIQIHKDELIQKNHLKIKFRL